MTEPGAPTASDQRPMTPAEWRRRCEVALRVIEAEPRRPWRWRVVAAGRAVVGLAKSRITLYLVYGSVAAASAGMFVSNVDWQSRLQVERVLRQDPKNQRSVEITIRCDSAFVVFVKLTLSHFLTNLLINLSALGN